MWDIDNLSWAVTESNFLTIYFNIWLLLLHIWVQNTFLVFIRIIHHRIYHKLVGFSSFAAVRHKRRILYKSSTNVFFNISFNIPLSLLDIWVHNTFLFHIKIIHHSIFHNFVRYSSFAMAVTEFKFSTNVKKLYPSFLTISFDIWLLLLHFWVQNTFIVYNRIIHHRIYHKFVGFSSFVAGRHRSRIFYKSSTNGFFTISFDIPLSLLNIWVHNTFLVHIKIIHHRIFHNFVEYSSFVAVCHSGIKLWIQISPL